MIPKFIGGALLTVAGVMLGNSVLKKYKSELALWRSVAQFISFCESEITFNKTELSAVVDKYRHSSLPDADIIADCLQYDTEEQRDTACFSLLRDFRRLLGSVDAETQKKVFSDVSERVASEIAKASAASEKGKNYAKLFPLLAVGIFILFL